SSRLPLFPKLSREAALYQHLLVLEFIPDAASGNALLNTHGRSTAEEQKVRGVASCCFVNLEQVSLSRPRPWWGRSARLPQMGCPAVAMAARAACRGPASTSAPISAMAGPRWTGPT